MLGLSWTSISSSTKPWKSTSARSKNVSAVIKSVKAKPFVIEETTLETEEIPPEDYAVPLNIELVHDNSEEV